MNLIRVLPAGLFTRTTMLSYLFVGRKKSIPQFYLIGSFQRPCQQCFTRIPHWTVRDAKFSRWAGLDRKQHHISCPSYLFKSDKASISVWFTFRYKKWWTRCHLNFSIETWHWIYTWDSQPLKCTTAWQLYKPCQFHCQWCNWLLNTLVQVADGHWNKKGGRVLAFVDSKLDSTVSCFLVLLMIFISSHSFRVLSVNSITAISSNALVHLGQLQILFDWSFHIGQIDNLCFSDRKLAFCSFTILETNAFQGLSNLRYL